MSDWQPIETAPRDGTYVLLAGGNCKGDEDDNDGRQVVAQWTNYLNCHTDTNYGKWQFAWYDGGYFGEYVKPTHWMPLPDPPQAG